MVLKVSLLSWQDRSETQEKMEVERKKVIMVYIRLSKSNKPKISFKTLPGKTKQCAFGIKNV